MKKVILAIIISMFLVCSTLSCVSNAETSSAHSDANIEQGTITEDNTEEKVTQSSEKILDNLSQKEKKIAEYTDKYNNETYAYTAYYLDMAQLYSIPIFIIIMTIGAFNYYIIGEKKLDKKEQGFGLIMASLSGLVLFQVLPLIFALLVAGK